MTYTEADWRCDPEDRISTGVYAMKLDKLKFKDLPMMILYTKQWLLLAQGQ